MACACKGGKKDGGPSSFSVKKPSGTTVAYRTKVEALAAAKRTGGTCTNC